MKRLLFVVIIPFIFSATAFAGHRAINNCTSCHTPNLITEHGGFDKESCSRCHSSTAPAVLAAIAKGIGGQAVSCSDCHGTASHLEKHPSYMSSWMTMSGVEPGPAAIWTQPTTFTELNPAQKQYQLCLRCHSYNGLGAAPNGVSTHVGPSGVNLTDQAMEFNPNNKSAHPVMVPLNSQIGSYAPKALSTRVMTTQWQNVGNQTMMCSDCHGNDATGPQGAMTKFMLKGTGKYWPTNASGKLWNLYDLKANQNNWKNDLFCANCHTLYSGNFMNKVHDKGDHSSDSYLGYRGAPCVMCHVAVPHGSKYSRLIAYKSDVQPRQYQDYAVMQGFKKTSASNYDKGNCWIPDAKWGCEDHEDKKMSYD